MPECGCSCGCSKRAVWKVERGFIFYYYACEKCANEKSCHKVRRIAGIVKKGKRIEKAKQKIEDAKEELEKAYDT